MGSNAYPGLIKPAISRQTAPGKEKRQPGGAKNNEDNNG